MRKLIGFGLLFLIGCYTVLKHPEISYTDSAGETYVSYVSYRSDCFKCHSIAEVDYYNLIPAHSSSPWVYYNTPWWFWRSENYNDTVKSQSTNSTNENPREFGSRRATSSNNTFFTPPPPTRTPPRSGSETTSDSSSSIGKGKDSKAGEGRDSSNIRSEENSRNQVRESDQNKEGKRNIGSKRR
ncbi:MAG: hypothetical protein ABDI07_07195 [Candidatus Kryptonium sp.]